MTETFVLVPGMWLGGWVWNEVATRLRAAGDVAIPVTLTGVGERAGVDSDLEQHVTDIIDAARGHDDIVLVGHSYGGMPVSAAATRIPVSRVVYVDSGPLPDGTRQLDMSGPPPESTDPVPPPSWEANDADPSLVGLDEQMLALLRERSTTHPYASVAQPLRRGGNLTAPATLIACMFSPEQITQMRAAGHPFFAAMGDDVVIRPLPTGHWPMLSEPARLAELLRA
ncbi:alpha/beta hydrolase [Asanoa sp. NPDC049573]|uniref:alpha/beta fold hydrolase n=1 Tax=Asanoa sp. NPDC049573 TaxID=3155396 RepID=UPI0034269875